MLKYRIVTLFVTLGLALSACAPIAVSPTATPSLAPDAAAFTPTAEPSSTATSEVTEGGAGMANPASVYCEAKGGKVEIRASDSGGEAGYCVFAGGGECEEWSMFQGACVPGGGELESDSLVALVGQTFPEQAFGDTGGITVTQLAVSEGAPLWMLHTYGMRNYDLNPLPSHLIAIYSRSGDEWVELASTYLDQALPVDEMLSADYLDAASVTQALIEPSHIWIDVQGGAGAHMGVYYLFSFDGEKLNVEIARNSPSPGLSVLQDLNEDEVPELMLDASDPYVFCYACGVRKVATDIFRYDGATQHMVQVKLQRMPEGQSGNLGGKRADSAVALAEAGLWMQALAEIDQAKMEMMASSAIFDAEPLLWDEILIRTNAEAQQAAIKDSAYPLLSNIFYGDYAAALDLMRSYGPEELFTADSPLIKGTMAENWLPEMTGYITQSATSALGMMPELAGALYLRGWAEYLADPADPQAAADLAEAADLAPKDVLITEGAAYVASGATAASLPTPTAIPTPEPAAIAPVTPIEFAAGATSAGVEGHLEAGAMQSYTVAASAGQYASFTVSSANSDVFLTVSGAEDGRPLVRGTMAQVTWSGLLPATQDYIVSVHAVGGAGSDYTLSVSIPARIEFAAGAVSADVTGELAANQIHEYLLRAMAGQTMTLSVTSAEEDVVLELYGLDDGEPLLRMHVGARQWSGTLPATQDYDIKAIATGGATSYTLTVTVE